MCSDEDRLLMGRPPPRRSSSAKKNGARDFREGTNLMKNELFPLSRPI